GEVADPAAGALRVLLAGVGGGNASAELADEAVRAVVAGGAVVLRVSAAVGHAPAAAAVGSRADPTVERAQGAACVGDGERAAICPVFETELRVGPAVGTRPASAGGVARRASGAVSADQRAATAIVELTALRAQCGARRGHAPAVDRVQGHAAS